MGRTAWKEAHDEPGSEHHFLPGAVGAKGTRLIVFGSHATGRAVADSDLDLLVVEPAVVNHHAEMARLSTLLGRHLIPADVVVMSAGRFECQKSSQYAGMACGPGREGS